jgi:two-component system, cell cycle sensor histidine kinase and response regulator CckA
MREKQKTIAIVDDSPADRETIRRYLLGDEQSTYRIFEAEDGETGLALCEEVQPDAILLDFLLPDMNGLEFLEELRTQLGQTNLPVVMLTGEGNEAIAVQAIKSGAKDYIVKNRITSANLRIAIGNVIEQTQLQQQLEAKEASFQVTFEQAAVGMARVGLDRKWLQVNQKLCDIVGYSRAELLGRSWQEIAHPDDVDGDLNDFSRLLAGEIETYSFDWRCIRKNGTCVLVDVTVSPIRKPNDDPNYLILAIQDISDRAQAQQALQQARDELEIQVAQQTEELQQANEELETMLEELQVAEEELRQHNEELLISQQAIELERLRYRDLFELAPDGYLVTDVKGNIQEANRAAASLLGVKQQRLIGKPLRVFITQKERQSFRMRLMELQQVQDWEIQLQPRHGDPFPAMLAVTSITDLQGEQIGLRWLIRDISIAKELEQQLQAARERLEIRVEERTAELSQANTLLQQQYQQQRLVTQMALRIRQSLNLDEILQTTVEEVRQFLECDRVIIFRFEPDWSGRVIMESVASELLAILSTPIYDPCFTEKYIEPYQQGAISMHSDIYTEELETCYVEFLAQFQVRANLVVPILIENREVVTQENSPIQTPQLWGLLIAHHCREPRQWQPLEIDLLKQLATQVGIAIQQSTLLQQTQIELAERKRAEQKIREQAALLDVATNAIFVRDMEGQILYWNKGAEDLYGWQRSEAMGKNAARLLYKQISTQLEAALTIIIEQGSWQGELQKVTKWGKDVLVESRWTLVSDEAGKPTSILIVDTDITEKKQLEQQFLRAQRLESLGTLAGGIAHDLNNMLTPILLSAQLLKDRLRDAQSQKLFNLIETNAKRGADLVKQVLSFARGVEGKRVPLQLGNLMLEIEQIIKRTFSKSIAVRTNIPTRELWTVSADATQLHQLLMNLCVNARDAMPDGGTLDLSAENILIDENYARMNLNALVGSYVAIAIADTGVGIPPEQLERIFDPFYTTKEVGKGTGLGLSTVLGIVKSHGGFVNVTSEVGRGSQFKVYLPAVEATVTQETEDLNRRRGQGELILVVDDETSIQEITTASLEAHNYRVIIARDGLEAIALFAQHQNEISVVLMDIMMPNMDGLTAIRTLQKINPQVKIIATSGLVSNGNLTAATGAGVQAFLQKPYTANELLETLDLVITGNG